jgi:hypothetical protein
VRFSTRKGIPTTCRSPTKSCDLRYADHREWLPYGQTIFEIIIKEAQSPASVDIKGQQKLSKMNDIKRARQELFMFLQLCVMCSQHLINMLLN